MAFDAIPIQCLRHIGELAGGIGKLTARMRTMAEGTGNALSVDLIFFPELVGP